MWGGLKVIHKFTINHYCWPMGDEILQSGAAVRVIRRTCGATPNYTHSDQQSEGGLFRSMDPKLKAKDTESQSHLPQVWPPL